MFPSRRKQSEAHECPGWEHQIRQKLEVPAEEKAEWRQWCTSGCLPAPDTLILLYTLIFFLFSKMSMISVPQLLFISFPMSIPLGPTGCQGAAQDQRCLAKHRAPLNSGVRRRQRWMRNSFLSGISCLGAGKVVRDSNLNYKFSVSINIPPR